MGENKKISLLGIATIAGILVLISGLNRPHYSPFKSGVEFDNLSYLSASDDCIVAVDRQQNRMLVANGKGKLTKVIDLTKAGYPVDRIGGVTIYNDSIYLIGSTHFDAGGFLSSEKVLACDLRGKSFREIYSRQYARDSFATKLTFNNISTNGQGIFISSVEGKEVSLKRIDSKTSLPVKSSVYNSDKAIYQAKYFPAAGTMLVLARSRNATFLGWNDSLTCAFVKENDLPECSGIEYLSGNFSVTYGSDGKETHFTYVSPDTRTGKIFNAASRETSSVTGMDYSFSFRLYQIAFMLAVVFAVIAAIILIVKAYQRNSLKSKKTLMLVVGAIVLATTFYSLNGFHQMKSQYEQNIRTQGRQLSFLLTKVCAQNGIKGKISDVESFFRSEEHEQFMDEVEDVVANLCNAHSTECSLYSRVWMFDTAGNVYTAIDSRRNVLSGVKVGNRKDLNLTDESKNEMLEKMRADYANITYDYDFFYDTSGAPIGVITVGYYNDNLVLTQTTRGLSMILTLLCIFIALYVGISSFKAFHLDILRFRSRDKWQTSKRAVDMSGILIFVYILASSLDNVIVVYVAKSLCDGMSEARLARMVALPIAAASAGCWIGTALYPALRRKLGDKIISIFAGIPAIASLLLTVFSIQISSIYVFAAAKFLVGLFLIGMMYMLVNNLPMLADNDEEASAAVNSAKNANIAATIIAALTGGYIAEYLSYSVIYIIAAVLVTLLVVLSLLIFTGKKNPSASASKADNAPNNGWKFLCTGPIIVYTLLFILPNIIVSGYGNFLFPLYSAGCGITALLLSNLKVFSKAVCFVLGGSSINSGKRHTEIMSQWMLLACSCLLCFLISPNIYWAIATFFVIEIANRFCNTASTMYVRQQAIMQKYDPVQAASSFSIIKSAMYIGQSPAMSAFTAFGYNLACSIVGVVCGAMFSLFTLYNHLHKSKQRI